MDNQLTQKQRDTLAEFMGWKLEDMNGNPHWFGSDGTSKYYQTDVMSYEVDCEWHPDQNIEQAMMLLDKFEVWDLNSDLGCNIGLGEDKEISVWEDTLQMSICKAVLKAKEAME